MVVASDCNLTLLPVFPSHIFGEKIGTASLGGQLSFTVRTYRGRVGRRAAGTPLAGSSGHHGAKHQTETK